MNFTEKKLKSFSMPLSDTEDQKCKHAIQEVRDSMANLGFEESSNGITRAFDNTSSYQTFMKNNESGEKIKIFLQGSYANNTNIKAESDVDVAIVREEIFNTLFRSEGISPQNNETFGFYNVPQKPITFKDRVDTCLRASFHEQVIRHNKSIKVLGNSYRKDADTVPANRYRNYQENYSNDPENYIGGIIIKPDHGTSIINYPEQHIRMGRQKNIATNHFYKKQVRIMKSIKSLMNDGGYASSQKMSSFGLESLTWNIPDSIFTKYEQLRYVFDDIVIYLTDHLDDVANFKEANGIKKLCNDENQVMDYLNFISDLKSFYEFEIGD